MEHIIEHKCGEAQVQMMKEYRIKAKVFCERRVSEFQPGSIRSNIDHTGMEEICVTLDMNDFYLKRIKNIKVIIANILGCSASKLVVKSIEIGSVEVVFLVVASVGDNLFGARKFTPEQEENLRNEHILTIKYKSVLVFQACTETKIQQTGISLH